MTDSTRGPLDSDRDAAAERALVRATFEAAPDALAVFDAHNRPVAFNPAFLALWQFPPDVLQRRNAAEMQRHVALRLKDPQAFLHAVAPAGPRPASAEFVHVDGRVLERKLASLARAGHPGAMVVRWRDVTSRRLAEAALKAADARAAAVFDHALHAILLADDQGCYIDANPAACRLLGRERDELKTLSAADVVDQPAADLARGWASFLQLGTVTGEVTLRRPDGSKRVARYSAVAHILPGVHLSMLVDATDEMQARQRELETAAQMDMAMANADMVFFAVDLLADRVTTSSRHWLQQMLGYAPHELPPGLTALDALVHPDDFERREAAWQAHVEGRSPAFEAEFRLRHKDGHWIWLLARGRATARDAQGRATRVVGTRIDITRRKLAEQLLEAQAFSDALTGTLNRRRFLELAAVEVERARRHDQPLSLLMIDLDHFKSVNDTHGHAGGDAVLKSFVTTALSLMRGSDVFGRVGGEEFAALLPQTDLEGAASLALRLRTMVQEHPVALPAALVAYSVSIGVAARPPDPTIDFSIESLMLAADDALYRAKGQGRNRVLLAGQS